MFFSFDTPTLGDIIFTDRGIYKHYGVYIGHGQVIHFAGPKGHETDPTKADIILTSIEDFLRGDELSVEFEPENFKYKSFPPSEIVRRAKSKIGTEKGYYNLVDNNCEHFANWCKYDVKFSRQVDKVASNIVKIAKPVVEFFYWLSAEDIKHEVPSLGLTEIIRFFKTAPRLCRLRADSNILPIVIKEKSEDGYTIYSLIYDKKTDEIDKYNSAVWLTPCLKDDLEKIFGNRNMIILK